MRLIIVSTIVFTLTSFSQLNLSTNEKVKGRVKKLIHIDYQILWDSIPHPQIKKSGKVVIQYDKKGNPTIEENYYSDSLWQRKSIFRYNEKGLKISSDVYTRFKDYQILLTSHSISTYDKSDHLIELYQLNVMPNRTSLTTYTYDSKGYKTSQYIFIDHDSLKTRKETDDSKINYKYDGKENLLERDILRQDSSKSIYRYNSKGETIEHDEYQSNGDLDRKYLMRLDKNRNSYTDEYDDADKLLNKTISRYTYDKTGNWTIDSTFCNDTLINIRTQEFKYR